MEQSWGAAATPRGAPVGAAGPMWAPGLRPAAVWGATTAVLLAVVSAGRLLPDWEDGRYWLLSAVGLSVAALAGTLALVQAVTGTGEALRRRAQMTGAPVGVALVLATSVVLGLVGLRGADDWYDLDVPAAWERLGDDLDPERDDPLAILGGAPASAEAATAGRAGSFRTTARIGECRTGDAGDPGDPVDCDSPHTLEVTGQVVLEPDLAHARAPDAAVAGCEADDAVPAAPEGGATAAVVPTEVEWEAGRRDALCLVVWSSPVEGARTR